MICTVCKNNNAASHYCTDSVSTSKDYTELLCSECVETHKKQRATRDHIISALSLNICTVCEKNNDASHYCSDSVCTSEEYTEYLCLECVETHKRQRATRNHIINAVSAPANSPISPVPPPIPPKIYPISESYLKNIDDDYHDFNNDYNDDLYDDYNDYHIRRMRITMITADCHGEPTVTFSNCDDDDYHIDFHGNVEQIC